MSDIRVIYKYEVKSNPGTFLPSGAQIIDCQEKDGNIYVWAIVDPDFARNPGTSRPDIFLIGTGWEIEIEDLLAYDHYKTFHINGYVWHVFTKKEVV